MAFSLGSFVARGGFVITPGAGAMAKQAHGIYVGGAGNISVTCPDGSTLTFTAVPAGTILPIRATHVTAATATGLIGFRAFDGNIG